MSRLAGMLAGAVAGMLPACDFEPGGGGVDGAGDGPGGTQLVPSNIDESGDLAQLYEAVDAPALASFRADDRRPDGMMGFPAWRIYTDDGEIEFEGPDDNQFVTYRAAGSGLDATTGIAHFVLASGIAVVVVDEFGIDLGVRVEGHGTRPLIVVARGAIVINGLLDFSGGFVAPGEPETDVDPKRGGPGGGDGATDAAVATGCGAGTNATEPAGGGGGGMAISGGTGGLSMGQIGGAGGVACGAIDLIPLAGGGGGGRGGVAAGGLGGGGGGAVQLTSLISIQVAGVIDAGGKGGRYHQVNDRGGGGGGAGGGILLEAPVIAFGPNAVAAANGGGGGSGRETSVGTNGRQDALPAAGGAGSGGGDLDGRGGDGGAAAIAPTAGNAHDPGGGGGGGGYGVIRINHATLTIGANATISPVHSEGALVYR